MGYGYYWDKQHHRDAGYNVMALCDETGCYAVIDRGLAYRCEGCKQFFCGKHLFVSFSETIPGQRCPTCLASEEAALDGEDA